MSFKEKVLTGIGAAGIVLLLWIGQITRDYFDPASIAHTAMREQLKLFGSALYEYHASTGRWPNSLDDLASPNFTAENQPDLAPIGNHHGLSVAAEPETRSQR